MELLIIIYKFIIATGLALLILNQLRVAYWVIKFISSKSDIDVNQIKRAKSIFYIGIISIWVISSVLFFIEENLYGSASRFTPELLYIIGVTLLTITILSCFLAVISAQNNKGRDKANAKNCSVEFKRLINSSFCLTSLIWGSSWFLS